MLSALTAFANGNLDRIKTIAKMEEMRAGVSSLPDENFNELAQTILSRVPDIQNRFAKGVREFCETIDQKKLVSDCFKKYISTIAERNADVKKVLPCFEPNYLLESQPDNTLLEQLKYLDIPGLRSVAQSCKKLRIFAEDNTVWRTIAKRQSLDLKDSGTSFKQQVRYLLFLRQQIKSSPFFPPWLTDDKFGPPTDSNIQSLLYRLIRKRLPQKVWESCEQKDVKEALETRSFRFLEQWQTARDILVVWRKIAEQSTITLPAFDMSSGEKMIKQAAGFSNWVKAHQIQLALLSALDLSAQSLTSLPSEISHLTGLTRLNLSANRLTSLPPWIGQLTGLTHLDLSQNPFSAYPPELLQLTHLRELRLPCKKHSYHRPKAPSEFDKLDGAKQWDCASYNCGREEKWYLE